MQDEVELQRHETVLVRGTTSSLAGTAVLTTRRVLFFDEKFSAGGGGIIEDAVAGWLQHRHEAGGPAAEVPLSTITRLARETKLFAKDRIRISAAGEEYLFNEGWKAWSHLLLGVLTRNGRRVVQETADVWRVEPT